MPKNANNTKNTNNTDNTNNANNANNQPQSIEQKIAQLDASVEWFYGDEFNLDEALPKYQAAAALATSIEKDLTELKNKVEVLEDFTKN